MIRTRMADCGVLSNNKSDSDIILSIVISKWKWRKFEWYESRNNWKNIWNDGKVYPAYCTNRKYYMTMNEYAAENQW